MQTLEWSASRQRNVNVFVAPQWDVVFLSFCCDRNGRGLSVATKRSECKTAILLRGNSQVKSVRVL